MSDDEAANQRIKMALHYDRWEARIVTSLSNAVEAVREHSPDAAVLDTATISRDEALKFVLDARASGEVFPVLYLIPKEEITGNIPGLSAGGDCFIASHYSIEGLLASIRGLVRGRPDGQDYRLDPSIRVGDLILNEESYEVLFAGEPISLTGKEFDLLRFFMRNPDRVFSKSQILDRVWNYDFSGKPSVVELYISYLRKKVSSEGTPGIVTVRRAGYMLKTP
ncbi:response regulator transcription factor [Leucobacter sp. cx-42]|uniref:response regulator transcription factor n=1 Tax=unclassified Leucobacter TaxID=2621730 RepID=UPI00165D9FB2|nr:response regulator transcription factor [Leucobacter sp. cx-42]